MGAAGPAVVFADNAISKLPKDIWLYTGLFALALLIGAAIIAAVERWRKRQANETFTAHDHMASFRLLYERGELSQQEYDRIKKQLLVKLKTGDAAAVVPDAVPKDSPPPESPPQPGATDHEGRPHAPREDSDSSRGA